MSDFLKCGTCGKMVKLIYNGDGELICCGKPMQALSQFGSIEQILDFAIEKEQEAHDFYMEWAEKLETPSMSDVFRSFAGEEKKHKEKILRVKNGGSFRPAAKQVTDLKIVDYLVDLTPSPDMDYQEALIIAMKREKASFKLYSDLAGITDNEEIRDLFLALAQEEAKHKLRLETEYEKDIYTEN